MVHGISSNFILITQLKYILCKLCFSLYIYPISHIKINISSVSNRCTSDCSEHCKLPTCVWHNSNIWGSGGRFKNAYELLTLRALKFQCFIKDLSFNVWVRYFVWNFKGTLWNSTQNILPIHWKIWLLYNIEILRALRFKSSFWFLKRPPADTFIYMCVTMKSLPWQMPSGKVRQHHPCFLKTNYVSVTSISLLLSDKMFNSSQQIARELIRV